MYIGHFVVYGFEMLLWPFTYFFNPIINDMYLIFSVYVGTFFGAALFVSVLTLMILEIANQVVEANLPMWAPWAEMLIYIVLVLGGWLTVLFMSEDAAIYLTHKVNDDGSFQDASEYSDTVSDLAFDWEGLVSF